MSAHLVGETLKHSRARGAERLVLICLAEQANEKGECGPSVEEIATVCGISIRSVHRHLVQLVALGELRRVERPGRASVYIVIPAAVQADESRAESTKRSRKGPGRRPISAVVRLRIYTRDGFRCRNCGTHKSLTVDHVVPVSRGGSDDETNLQTLCRPCNSRKGAKLP